MPNLLGTAPNQVPTNGDLGKLAFMDVVDTVTNNPYVDTAISDTKPTLLLDFANSKTLDPRITYTRASTATYTDYAGLIKTAAAGVPRFDHDPVTGESKGFLIEEQRSNLYTYSSAFDNAAWTKSNATIIADTVVAPDGTLTGDKFVEDTSAFEHYVYQGSSITSGTTYTFSCFVKQAERTAVRIQGTANTFGTYTQCNATFNLATGTLINAGSLVVSSFIQPVGNGWFKCGLTLLATGTATGGIFMSLYNNGVTTYTGNGTSGLYIWGAQLEAGSFATSYIPTTSAQVTRSADAASMTGGNFSSWYNQAEGTFFMNTQRSSAVYSGGLLCGVSSGAFANSIYISEGAATTLSSNIIVGSVNQAQLNNQLIVGNELKVAFCFKTNDSNQIINGSSFAADTLCSIPTGIINFSIGSAPWTTANFYNGTIKKLAYYPKRLSDAELQEMTQ